MAHAKQLMYAFLRYPFQKYEQKVFLAIKHLTVDRGHTEAEISSRYLAAMTTIHRANIRRTIRQLVNANVIVLRSGEDPAYCKNFLSINPDFTLWQKWPVDNSKNGESHRTPEGSLTGLPIGESNQTPEGSLTRLQGGVLRDSPNLKPVFKAGINKPVLPEENRPVNNKANSKADLKELMHGFENHVTDRDPRDLVDHLMCAGFDRDTIWAACVQTRLRLNAKDKTPLNKPAGYFIKILGDPGHQLSDESRRLAKEEMRKLNFF